MIDSCGTDGKGDGNLLQGGYQGCAWCGTTDEAVLDHFPISHCGELVDVPAYANCQRRFGPDLQAVITEAALDLVP